MNRNFLALDLEMNTSEDTGISGKIIQVGVAIGNFSAYLEKQNFVEKSWYVNPHENIHPRITELTGINDEIVKSQGVDISEVYKDIHTLMQTYDCYVNPVVWGSGDVEKLKSEVLSQYGSFRIFGHREIDTKTIFTFYQLCKGRKTNSSLSTALSSQKLRFVGTPHRAVDDARNTLILFFEMIKNQKLIFDNVQELYRAI